MRSANGEAGSVVGSPAVFEAGAVVLVFGEPFGVALHDVVEDSEDFACGSVYFFHVVVGIWLFRGCC